MTDLTLNPVAFQPASAIAFRHRNRFAQDVALVGPLLDAINDQTALAAMLDCIDRGVPPLAGVVDRLLFLLAPLFRQADADAQARQRAHRMRRLCGSLVREVLDANSCRKTGRSVAMPEATRGFAGRGATFERITRQW